MAPLQRIADKPTWLLSRANARAHALLADALSAEGVRGYHLRLLAALDEHGPASQSELGRLTGLDRSDVTVTLDDLVGDGLARRDPDPDDRRRNVVAITRKGRTRLDHLTVVLAEVQDEVLAPLTSTERKTLVRLLVKLAPPDP